MTMESWRRRLIWSSEQLRAVGYEGGVPCVMDHCYRTGGREAGESMAVRVLNNTYPLLALFIEERIEVEFPDVWYGRMSTM
jgi:hypothetical protein